MANDMISAGGGDANITVTVDGSKAIAESILIAKAIENMAAKSAKSIDKMGYSFNKMRKSFDDFLPSFGKTFAVAGISVAGLTTLLGHQANKLIEVNRMYTGFIATMNVVKGSTAAAKKEYEFLLNTSNRLGVEVSATIPQYAKLAAALKNVDTSGELTRNLFVGVSEAAVVLHSRGRDVTLIFEAFQQMASKGKLSLEELQRQLGNTLPGAVGMAARAMKMSEIDLRKGIEKGTIDVYEFLAKVANQLKVEYGGSVEYAASQFTAKMNVMKNSLTEFYREVGSSGAMDGFIKVVEVIRQKIEQLDIAEKLGGSVGELANQFSEFLENITVAQIEDLFGAISIGFQAMGETFRWVGEVLTDFNPESQSPLTEFSVFMLRWVGGIADLLAVLVSEFMTAVNVIKEMWYDLSLTMTEDFAKPMERIQQISNIIGLQNDGVNNFLSERNLTMSNRDQAAADSTRWRNNTASILSGEGSLSARIKNLGDTNRDNQLNKATISGNALLSSITSSSANEFTGNKPFSLLNPNQSPNYFVPQSQADLEKMVNELNSSGAPNSKSNSATGGKSKTNVYLKEQTSLLKELSDVQNEYQNIASGRANIEGENENKVRTLISADERYSKLTQDQKGNLISLAQNLDGLILKRDNLIKVTEFENETLQQNLEIQKSIAQLQSTGYESKYNQASNLEREFSKGGKYEFVNDLEKDKLRGSATGRDDADRLLEMERYTQSLRQANKEIEFQNTLYGKTKEELEVITKEHEIDLWIAEQSVGASDKMKDNYAELAKLLKADVTSALRQFNSQQDDILAGLKDGMAGAIDAIGTPFERFSSLALDSINNISDAFSTWITTGKMDFKSLAAMMLSELAKVIFQLYVIKPLLEYMKSSMNSSGGGGILGSLIDFGIGLIGSGGSVSPGADGIGTGPYAKGGVFDGGIQQFAKGSPFKANGGVYGHNFFNMAEMGEKGPEAIMPLSRGKDGVLGVRMSGMSSSSGDDIAIYVTVNAETGQSETTSSGAANQDLTKLGKMIGNVVRETIIQEKRVGGILYG
jgi:lambda family phage tail tape measure protein